MIKTDDLHDITGAVIGARFTLANGDDVTVQTHRGRLIGYRLHPTLPEMTQVEYSLPLTTDFKVAAAMLFS